MPEFAVVGATEAPESEDPDKPAVNVYVCRARHEGSWIPGQLVPKNKACLVSLLTRVMEYPRYQVLQNVENGAKLGWVKWDKFQAFPTGAIFGGDNNFFVARRKADDQEDNSLAGHLQGRSSSGLSHFVGKINPQDGLGKVSVITDEKREAVFTDGEVLVETEPNRYELANIKYNKMRRKIVRKPVALAATILRNENLERSVKLDSALAYDSEYSSSWGQVRSVLKGLPTTVRNQNGSILIEIKWGLTENEDRKDVYR